LVTVLKKWGGYRGLSYF